jgi:hypothetical protein
MANTDKLAVYAQLKETFPKAATIEVSYEGSGDSFGDFWSVTAYDSDNKELKDYSSGEIQHIIEDYCFEVFEMSGEPDFNNDGSEGTIKFDILNQVTTLDNYTKYVESRHTGTEYF